MRAGYAGRGLVYLVIAGFSLWAIWRGGEAEGTGGALKKLDNSGWGMAVLWLIAIGLFAYMVWRVVDAIWDLEDYGTDGKGVIARIGMVVTGLIHGAIGVGAVSLIFGSGGSGEDSKITYYVGQALGVPFGRWLVGIAGLITLGAGIYYLHKGWTGKYREKLQGSGFTESINWAMKAGLVAQGLIVGIVGFFLARAGYMGRPEEAGGLKQVFEFLGSQAFGQVIVVAVCLGLLGFSLFCFINARYRIVPKAADDGVQSLAARLG